MYEKRLHNRAHYFLLLAAACIAVAIGVSCTDHDEAHSTSSGMPIAFSTEQDTRAAVVTNETLTDIGLFGYYTTQSWSAAQSAALPDYFYNIELSRTSSTASWSYSPLKYWPNEGYISFFGYSPYRDAGDAELILSSADQVGAPTLSYTIADDITNQVDLLWAKPVYDQVKSTSPVLLEMYHALARVNFTAQLSADEADRGYTVTVEKIELTDVYNSGTLDLSTGLWTTDATTSDYVLGADSGLNAESNNLIFSTDVVDDYTTTRNLLANDDYLFLMPQNFSEASRLILTVSLNGGDMANEVVTTEFNLSEVSSVWTAGEGMTYHFTLNGKTLLLEVLAWDGSGSTTVIDGQNYLSLSETDFQYDKWGSSDAKVAIETNLDSWTATLVDDTQDWLHLRTSAGEAATLIEGVSGESLHFIVDDNADTGSRTGKIRINAGTMSVLLTISQDDSESELNLVLSTSELLFVGRQYNENTGLWEAPDPQIISITYAPAQFDYSIALTPYFGGGVGDIDDVIGKTESSDSELTVTLTAIAEDNERVVENPFYERSSRLTFTVVNSSGEEMVKTAVIRQIYYSLVLTGPSRTYYMKGGTYEYSFSTNAPWEAVVEDPSGILLNFALPSSGGQLNTVESQAFSFLVNTAVENGSRAYITLRSPDNLFPERVITIEAQQSISNSIIVSPGNSTEISMRKPYSMWLTDPDLGVDIENDISGEIGATLVWQDAQNLISSVSIAGSGKDAVITVQSSGQAEGNAIVAFTKNNTIYWSWHIWVTDFNPLETSYTVTINGVSTEIMDRHLGALAASPLDDTGVLDDDLALNMRGLFYQTGRKDPFVAPGSLTSNSATDFKPMYDINNNVLDRQVDFATSDTPNLDNAIMHPDVFYKGIYGNTSWYANLLDMRIDFWEVNKTDFDPCPTGWKVASMSFLQSLRAYAYTFDNYAVHFDQIGYLPAQGYLFSDFVYTGNNSFASVFGVEENTYPRAVLFYQNTASSSSRPAVAANVRCVRRTNL